MSPTRLLDAHIHLWPSTATSPRDHTWMTSSTHPLAKRHGITDYTTATTSHAPPPAFLYVETDRHLPGASPHVTTTASADATRVALQTWAQAPLDEIRFLRRIVEGAPEDGDGFVTGDGDRMRGVVLWAPFHVPAAVFDAYLSIAEEVAGPVLWGRVVGFRFLLQGKREGEVKALVGSEAWVGNVVGLGKGRGGKGWVFDVGVDSHRDGVQGLEEVAGMVEQVRKREGGEGKVRFVINHLAKPPLSAPEPSNPDTTWLTSLSHLGKDPLISIKLSGLLNEFTTPTPSTVPDAVSAIAPYVAHIFKCFPGRVMFGSDWPVCNVGGPRGEDGNWGFWRDIVAACVEREGGDGVAESVWWRAAASAYGVDLD